MNPTGKLFALLALALYTSGCAHAKTKSVGRTWRITNIHKVVVICAQGDGAANRRVESSMVPKLRHQGFDAVAAQDFFPTASQYSPKNLMDLMHRAQVDGIMEIIYSGTIPANGLPRRIRFKYHSIKGPAAELPDRTGSLDPALAALLRT